MALWLPGRQFLQTGGYGPAATWRKHKLGGNSTSKLSVDMKLYTFVFPFAVTKFCASFTYVRVVNTVTDLFTKPQKSDYSGILNVDKAAQPIYTEPAKFLFLHSNNCTMGRRQKL